jgi:LssY C-terminus
MLISLLLVSLLAGTAAVAAPLAPEPPSNAIAITAQLLTPLSSYRSKVGDAVEAVISTPVCFADGPLAAEARLQGVIERVHRVGLGLAHETASLEFKMQQLLSPDGRSYPIEARLTAVDNARERVDRRGVIHGIRATDTLSSRFSSHLFFVAHVHPALIIPSLAVESWLFRFPEPEFDYGVGTELALQVTFPEELGHPSACSQTLPTPEDEAAWEGLVAELPSWSYSKRQPQPIDPVNLLFLGSLADLERAFRAAGWNGSQPNNFRTGFQAVRAIAEDSSYADAPMRTLLLDGAPPDLRVQRSLNTFDKRDHMRIWLRDDEWQGHDVWAAAATQDLAATFSTRHPFGFTHRIQTDVDLERDKVVRELEFTGCVDQVVRVQRPDSDTEEAELRRGLETDSRVAVVLLNSCEHPHELPVAGSVRSQDDDDTNAGPPLATRVIRRVTLTARNHFLRDNLIWRTGEALEMTWHTVRNWEAERKRRATVLLSVRN